MVEGVVSVPQGVVFAKEVDSLLAVLYEFLPLMVGRYLSWRYYLVVFNVEWWLGKIWYRCRCIGQLHFFTVGPWRFGLFQRFLGQDIRVLLLEEPRLL